MCQSKAEWQIIHGPSPDDYTMSCTDHVGRMLTDARSHEIIPNAKDEPCCFIGPQLEDTIHENGVLLTRDPAGRVIEIRAGGQWVYLDEEPSAIG